MRPNSDRMHLFLCSNESFKIGTCITLLSLIDHLSKHQRIQIHILNRDFSQDTEDAFRLLIQNSSADAGIDFKKIDAEDFTQIRQDNRTSLGRDFPIDVYLRLFIPVCYPEVEFGIYLDSDILVQKDLSQLLEYKKEAIPLAAIIDKGTSIISHENEFLDCEALGLNPQAPYFNSGFLVMNLKLWERESFLGSCFDIARKTKVRWADQSILNVLYSENWSPIDTSWNNMVAPWQKEYLFPKTDTNYHFYGPSKPWDYPPTLSFGIVRKIHNYLKRAPADLLKDYKSIRKPYPFFLLKRAIKNLTDS